MATMQKHTRTEMEKLKPCPFCGNDEDISLADNGRDGWNIFCPNCCACLDWIDKTELIEIWENRDMTAKSENRGNEIEYENGAWGIMAEHEVCAKCGNLPDERGYDSCLTDLIDGLNMINGVKTLESCCGHGRRPAWIWFIAENKKALFDAIGFLNPSYERGDRIEVEIKAGNKLVYVAHIDNKA